MNISPDDPRLTAFALGEIEDPNEARQIEEAVAASPELREAVEAIRATASALEEAFAAEPAPEMSEAEKEVLITRSPGGAATEAGGESPILFQKLISWPWLAAAAAVVAIGLILASSMIPVRESARHASVMEEQLQERSNETEEARPRPSPAPRVEPLREAPAAEQPRLDVGRVAPESAATPDAVAFESPPVEARREMAATRTREETVTAGTGETGAPAANLQDRVRELLRVGRAHYLNGDLEAAEQAFRELLAIDPNNAEAEAMLRRIAEDKIRRQHLDREETRAEMLASVESAWQRPQIYFDGDRESAPRRPQAPRQSAYGSVGFMSEPTQDQRWPGGRWNLDAYDPIEETGFRSPLVAPLSTFSIDVDTASYSHVRSLLTQGQMPPAGAVRIEEFINYFPYSDAPPAESLEDGGAPFAVHLEQAIAPWAPEHRLLRVALKGYELPWDERPPSNLVFLIDVSGSMNRPNRLPLVKEALGLLVERLDERDRVAIVVYAGTSRLSLPSTTANNRETIRHAIDQLVASGGTHASDGIQRAYEMAHKHFIEDGNNRVILCTDGDFNVGITDRGELGEFVQKQADKGVSLTVLGFGMGNYKDNMLETLSAKGKGVYGYIDTEAEARKFFLQQLASNLFTIAHDVKIQVEFNPAEVRAYRLIGYENRRLQAEDFNDDTKRAGDIGPGHSVVAFYEIVPPEVEMSLPGVDALRYQAPTGAEAVDGAGELGTVKVRYKRPGEEVSELIVEHAPAGSPARFEEASEDFRFGAAAAGFGMRLSDSEYAGKLDWETIRRIGLGALGSDPGGHRAEFTGLVDRAARLEAASGPGR